MPTIVRVKPIDPKLINAIVVAAKAHSKGACGGSIALEAYDALSLNAAAPGVAATLTKEMIAAVVPAMQELLAFRITLYQKGIPPEFHAERRPAFFLTNDAIWRAQTEPQKLQTMQLLSDLISLIANQAVQPNVPSNDRTELLVSIGFISRSMSVAAASAGAKGTVTALEPLTRLVDGNTARLVKNDEVIAAVGGVYQALKADKTFGTLKPPPAAIGHEQAPPPASAPTTGPVVIPGAGPAAPPGATPPPITAPTPPPAPKPAPKAAGGTAPKPPAPTPTAPKAPGAATGK
jgi:hypothetical protein